MYKFLILLGTPGEHAILIDDGVDDIVLHSENYRCRCSCEDEVDLIKEICHKDSSYERRFEKPLRFYFTINDEKGRSVVYSRSFNNEDEREDEIARLKQYLQEAEVMLVEKFEDV